MSDAHDLPDQIGPYRNRIKGLRVMPVKDLIDNPHNWRLHPKAQQDGLDAVMRQVGVIDVVRFNEPTGRLFDGHLRKKLFSQDPDTPVIVLVTDLTLEEEALALATFDPLGGMAEADHEGLLYLLNVAREIPEVADDDGALDLLRVMVNSTGRSATRLPWTSWSTSTASMMSATSGR